MGSHNYVQEDSSYFYFSIPSNFWGHNLSPRGFHTLDILCRAKHQEESFPNAAFELAREHLLGDFYALSLLWTLLHREH